MAIVVLGAFSGSAGPIGGELAPWYSKLGVAAAVLSGSAAAAGFVIAAKGLLRFREIGGGSKSHVDEITEYFLIGTSTYVAFDIGRVMRRHGLCRAESLLGWPLGWLAAGRDISWLAFGLHQDRQSGRAAPDRSLGCLWYLGRLYRVVRLYRGPQQCADEQPCGEEQEDCDYDQIVVRERDVDRAGVDEGVQGDAW